jgi:hypothetical protein
LTVFGVAIAGVWGSVAVCADALPTNKPITAAAIIARFIILSSDILAWS